MNEKTNTRWRSRWCRWCWWRWRAVLGACTCCPSLCMQGYNTIHTYFSQSTAFVKRSSFVSLIQYWPPAKNRAITGQTLLYSGSRAIFRNRSICFKILTRDFLLPGHESLTGRLRFKKKLDFLLFYVALRAASIMKNHDLLYFLLFPT